MPDRDRRIGYRFVSETMTNVFPDTVFALSSGIGKAGIAVVRISGPRALGTLKAFAGDAPQPRSAVVRKIRTGQGQIIDEALVLYFPAPHSATGEDIVEFHIHGAPAVISLLLEELSGREGLRMAAPGEFSKRAFANGKLDLVEVEGLSDLLAAQGEAQRRLAMRQFLGEASAVYENWRNSVLAALALHEAAIDFSDEDDVSEKACASAKPIILDLVAQLNAALARSENYAAVRSGLQLVIAGAPNVGKSSLMNALVGRDAAIVSPLAGTTRDVIEAQVMFEGLPLSVSDTAGLRDKTRDEIEREGMTRAQAAVQYADILVWVQSPDVAQTVGPPRKPDVVVWNKSDLGLIRTQNDSDFAISTQTGVGLAELRDRLKVLVQHRMVGIEDAVVVRRRHVTAIQNSIRLLNECLLWPDRESELVCEDLRRAARYLGEITGHVEVEELLGKIFGEFCIGK